MTAQLTRLNPEARVWADVYDRDLNDLFNVESNVVEAVVRRIQVTLSSEDRARWERRRPVRPEALQAYCERAITNPAPAV